MDYLAKGLENMKVANHVMSVTWNVVKDPKLLITIIEKTYDATMNLIMYAIQRAYDNKIIRIIPQSDEAKIALFDERLAYSFENGKDVLSVARSCFKLRQDLKKGIILAKDNKIILYKESYDTDIMTFKDVKEMLNKVKKFYDELTES